MILRSGLILLICGALAAACVPVPDVLAARQTLVEFFDHLANDEYDQAVDLYGGDYDQLMIFGPDIDPGDKPELWRNACNFGGLQCLPVASAALKSNSGGVLTFSVEFRDPNGGTFVLGPCCGGSAADSLIMSQFAIRVQADPQGTFVVLDPPVYVP